MNARRKPLPVVRFNPHHRPAGPGGGQFAPADEGGAGAGPSGGTATLADFAALADAQRGKPEAAMTKVQFANGGGVLNVVVEHTGDLTHRMSQKYAEEMSFGYEWVNEKVDKVLRYLERDYGFQREHEENLRDNARSRGITYEEQKAKVDAALAAYAEAHRELTPLTRNAAQRTANRAAIYVGEQRWSRAISELRALKSVLVLGRDAWVRYASEGLKAGERREWDPSKHPRAPAGSEEGGQFTSADGGASGSVPSGGAAVTHTPEFKAWFGASKVVDEHGAPLLVYHGTTADVSEFSGPIWVTPDAEAAAGFADRQAFANRESDDAEDARTSDEYSPKYDEVGAAGQNVMPVYAAIEKPLDLAALGQTSSVADVAEHLTKLGIIEEVDADTLDDLAVELSSQDETITAASNVPIYRALEVLGAYPDIAAKGFDGVRIKDTDVHGAPVDAWAAFRSEQIKSAVGNSGAFDPKNPDIGKDWDPDKHPRGGNPENTGQFSTTAGDGASPDGPPAGSAPSSVIRTPAFKRWFGDSKVVDVDGEPLVVYHGTASDISAFDPARSNVEADLGAGFYFTNATTDLGPNYAGEGPDLTGRIEQEAERLNDEITNEHPDWSPEQVDDAAHAAARERLSVENLGVSMPVYLSIQNPVVLGRSINDEPETYLDWTTEFDEHGDLVSESGKALEFLDALQRTTFGYDIHAADALDDVRNKIIERAMDGGITAREVWDIAKHSEKFGYITDDNGGLVSNEIIRETFERIGFDGIIDNTVNEKFGTEQPRRPWGQPKPMAGMDPGTVHYVAFKPTQIKSAVGNSGAFDPKNPDITKGDWDPDKHPRGGNPDNPGQFSAAPGSASPEEHTADPYIAALRMAGENVEDFDTVRAALDEVSRDPVLAWDETPDSGILPLIAANGWEFSREGLTTEPGVPQECHRNVAKLFLAGKVAGFATGYGNAHGFWFRHSWGLDKFGHIVETVVPFDRYYGTQLRPMIAKIYAERQMEGPEL